MRSFYKCYGTGTGNRKRYEKTSTQRGRKQKSGWSSGKMKPRGEHDINTSRVTKVFHLTK